MEKDFDPKEFLLFGLNHFGIEIEEVKDKYISTKHNYLIEIEGPSLFKLMHENKVVAPFGEVEALCNFIRQDIQLNYGEERA